LGKHFFDTTTVFASKAALASFDCLAETVVNIVCSKTDIPKSLVHGHLDYVPIVSTKASGLVERFVDKYWEVCKELNIPLAEECPNHEKAFGPFTYVTVLGIQFDSEQMEWSIHISKSDSTMGDIEKFGEKKVCTLKGVQKLHGKLANIAQAGEFMKGFRSTLLELI